MSATGAVVFLPREGSGPSLMLEELLFDPAARWLAESLRSAGVERFFVVCHSDDREQAAACFPAGTELVTGTSEDAVEQLVARAEALRPAPIREQMAQAAQAADKANAERPAPDRGKEARDDR